MRQIKIKGRFFDDYGDELRCPKCRATPMRLILANDVFYGCPNYRKTKCNGSVSADQGSGEPVDIPDGCVAINGSQVN